MMLIGPAFLHRTDDFAVLSPKILSRAQQNEAMNFPVEHLNDAFGEWFKVHLLLHFYWT